MALCIFSGTTQVSQYQKKHSPTHTYCGRQSSLICFLHLTRSMESSMFSLHTWQSFSTISPSFLCSTSWPGTLQFILHTFLHPIIDFTCPYNRNLFCCSTKIIHPSNLLIHNLLLLPISTIDSAVGKRLITHCCVSRLACSRLSGHIEPHLPDFKHEINTTTTVMNYVSNTTGYWNTLAKLVYFIVDCGVTITSLPTPVPPHFQFLQARSHFHATY